MRVAQVAPLMESVPPRLYGGTERVVHYLVEALAELGHEVHVFASADSRTRGVLHPVCQRALRLEAGSGNPLPYQILQLEKVIAAAGDFDLIHFHTDLLHFPVARRLTTSTLTTPHGRLDLPEARDLYLEFRDIPFSSISLSQRQPLAFLNWVGSVPHGLPENLLQYHPGPGRYLAFLGRISREKRVDRAVEIARRAGLRLKVAAKVDEADRAYYETVKELLREPHVEFLGEISEAEKSAFLGNAMALLFPIDWPEPFGLVMIESLATGTPVIAFPHGAVPEVIRPGVNGFCCASVEEAVAAVGKVTEISRADCRKDFLTRFSSRRMAQDYLRIYEHLAGARRRRRRWSAPEAKEAV